MPCPTGQQVFFYAPVETPVASADPSTAEPIGVTVAPDKNVGLQLNAAFDCSVDVTLSAFGPGVDPQDIFFVSADGEVVRLSESVAEAVRANPDEIFNGDASELWKKLENLVYYETDVFQVNSGGESIHGTFPSGVYLITLGVTPRGTSGQTSYRWTTFFLVP